MEKSTLVNVSTNISFEAAYQGSSLLYMPVVITILPFFREQMDNRSRSGWRYEVLYLYKNINSCAIRWYESPHTNHVSVQFEDTERGSGLFSWSPQRVYLLRIYHKCFLCWADIRSFVGNYNTPPSVSTFPIKLVPLGKTSIWNIPVVDTDRDIVRCRWATAGPPNECHEYVSLFSSPFAAFPLHAASVCGAPPNAHLDEEKCTIQYTPSSMTPWVIALKIEDFELSSPNIALSGTSLQFIVDVYLDTATCETRMYNAQYTLWDEGKDECSFFPQRLRTSMHDQLNHAFI